MDLTRHNMLLLNENAKLCAELKLVQTKLVQVKQSTQAQADDCEWQQWTIKELKLELAHNSTNHSAPTSHQIDLQVEKAMLIAADKNVLELQQLKTA